jgi:hypothetical protein
VAVAPRLLSSHLSPGLASDVLALNRRYQCGIGQGEEVLAWQVPTLGGGEAELKAEIATGYRPSSVLLARSCSAIMATFVVTGFWMSFSGQGSSASVVVFRFLPNPQHLAIMAAQAAPSRHYMTEHLDSWRSFFTLSATRAASVKASFTPRLRMAEHSRYRNALMRRATSRPWS